MAEIKRQSSQQNQTAVKQSHISRKDTIIPLLFTRENYKWMLIGGAVIILGMILMSGGRNTDPNVFDPNVVYSTTRVTIAPIMIVLGLLIEIYAIFRKPKQQQTHDK